MDFAKAVYLLFGILVVLFTEFAKGQVSVSSSAAASVKYNKGAPQAYISSLSSAKADPKVPVVIVRPTVPPPSKPPSSPAPSPTGPVGTQKPSPSPTSSTAKKAWDYRPGDNAYGPANWKLQWPQCSGNRQSPIDILSTAAIPKPAPWKLVAGNPDPAIAENMIVKGKLINNGRGLGYRVDEVATPIQLVFNNTYKLRQFHFHFGCEDEMGSEHSLDGKRFPGEIHFIFTNNKYPTVQSALLVPDGVISLAFFLDQDEAAQNKAFKRISDNINAIRLPKSNVAFPDGISLTNLVPAIKEGLSNLKVFAYRGSMPAPPCYESFTWLVFRRPVKINPVTLEGWRNNLQGTHGRICGNYRPVQPLNGRRIFTLLPAPIATPTGSPPSASPKPGTTKGPGSTPSAQVSPVARFRAPAMPYEKIRAGIREKAFAKLVGDAGNPPDERVSSADTRQELHPAQNVGGGLLAPAANLAPQSVGSPAREQNSAFVNMASGKDNKLLQEAKKQVDAPSSQAVKTIDNGVGNKESGQEKKPTVAPGMKRQGI